MSKSSHVSKTVAVFIDTSTHLGCKAFDEVDWLTLLDAESVTIIILPIIMGELDEKKDSHPNQRIRNRAKSIGKKFNRLFEGDLEASLRDHVTIKYDATEEKVDFRAKGLNPDRHDDKQLAGIMTFMNDHPDNRVVLIAQDFNLRTRAKAYGIEAMSMPAELELPDELDPNDKTIKELQQKILELEKQFPVLKLRFKDGSNHIGFTLKRFSGLSQDELTECVEQVKRKHPKMPVSPETRREESEENKPRRGITVQELAQLTAKDAVGYSQDDKRQYNTKLDQFYLDCEGYLKAHSAYVARESLTVELDTEVLNDGSAPADDIDVYLYFPDGFELREEALDEPCKPKPPDRPLTFLEALRQDPLRGLLLNRPFIPSVGESRINTGPPPNVSRPKIRRTKSYDVHFKVRRIKHNTPESLKSMYLTFDSFDTAKSFGIEYRINAGNMPREAKGFLNVVVKRED